MNSGLIALIIILLIIISAIKTRKCIECLLIGSFIASFFVFGTNFLTGWTETLQLQLQDQVWLLLFVGFFGSLTFLLQKSNACLALHKVVTKLCNTERKTLLTTFLLGILIFVDDYLNVLVIGTSMRQTYDEKKIPRETLAYLLDSTAAPVCVLIPFSTWAVFYADTFSKEISVQALNYGSAMETYIHCIPYLLYPIFTIVLMFMFCTKILKPLGPLKKCYKNSTKLNINRVTQQTVDNVVNQNKKGNILDFILPMSVIILLTVVLGDILIATIGTLILCAFLYIPRKKIERKEFIPIVIDGFSSVMPVITAVLITFILKDLLFQMGLTEYLINLLQGVLSAPLFPAVIFILSAFIMFTTGAEQFAMGALLAPVMFSLGASLNVNPLLTMGALVSGCVFGSHACFYSDATLLASQAAEVDNIQHAKTQLPYVLIATALTIIGYIILGFII